MTSADPQPSALDKVLASQWVVWETLAPYWGGVGEHGPVLAGIVDVVQHNCALELQYQTHEGGTADWLASLADKVTGVEFPSDEARDRCQPAVDELVTELYAPGGPFERRPQVIFEDAMRLTAGIYTEQLAQDPTEVVASARFEAGFMSDWSGEAPFRGRAATRYLNWPETRVELLLAATRMNELTVKSLPFVLFHEVFCHVLQGPWDGTRRASQPASTFAEGWMDFAALLAFDSAVSTRHTPESFVSRFAPAQLVATAGSIHTWRITESTDGNRFWAARHCGANAAAAVVEALTRELTDHAAASDVLVRASVSINASGLFTPADREALVWRVSGARNELGPWAEALMQLAGGDEAGLKDQLK